MSAPLTPALRDKLAKICSRLASAHDGERAAAALIASRLLRDAGLSWAEALAPARAAGISVAVPADWNPWAQNMACPGQHPDLRFLLDNMLLLNTEERFALARISPKRATLTKAQGRTVAYLVERVRVRMAERARE